MRPQHGIWWLMVGLAASACDAEVSVYDRVETESWRQTPTDKTDILWVIDDSNSMAAEQKALAAGFSAFAGELESTGVDFHIGVVTTTFLYDDSDRGQLVPVGDGSRYITNDTVDYVNAFQDLVQVGLDGDGKEKGLEAATYALSPAMTLGANAGFLRDEANLLVIFVSDEDDCSDRGALDGADSLKCYSDSELLPPVTDFVAEMQALKVSDDKVLISGIVGPENTSACIDTLTGTRYIEAARLTGGIVASICANDWSTVLYDLGLNATGIYTTFQLAHGARDGTLVVTIDGVEVPEASAAGEPGFTYDEDNFTITFYDPWVPERDAVITATYTVESGT